MQNLSRILSLLLVAMVLTACAPSHTTPPPGQTAALTTPPPAANLPVERTSTPHAADLAIAYIQDGDVWLWRQSSGPRLLNASGNAQRVLFSPDGALIAFTQEVAGAETEIWVMARDGSQDRRLLSSRQLAGMSVLPGSSGPRLSQIAWLPNSHQLAFSTSESQSPTGPLNQTINLLSVEPETLTTLFEVDEPAQFLYSPDGSKLALITPHLIRVLAASTQQELLSFPYDTNIQYHDPLQAKFFARPVWSQDSSFLMVAIPRVPDFSEIEAEQNDASSTTEIVYLPTNNTAVQSLGQFEDVFPSEFFPPLLSPDLTSALYSTPGEAKNELHLINIDGSHDVLIASQPGIFVSAWAPDSLKFVFSTQGPRGAYKLGRVDQPGYTDLADVRNVAEFVWLDAERILFTTRPAGGQPVELRLGLVDGLSILIAELPSYFISRVDFFIESH
ncbi:MAG: hypothetical protein OEZ02_05060 [Anaerolineae bacterium]|nr:hypothetical protein [Anaerolineae bacterium]